MKLVIPMSGQGQRFVQAGYKTPKPLIQVEGKPIIEHVLNMFPGEEDVIFICNEEHLANTEMRTVLQKLKPQAIIINVPIHQKGPVHAITYAFDFINDNEDVMVSYCDFSQKWNYDEFKQKVANQKFAGAIPAYSGFHPHLLRKNVYAGILTDTENMLCDIKEKHCFTENPEDSHHSSGAYYFGNGALLKKYSAELIETNINLNGEYYASMLYYLLLRDQLPIYVPPIEHFMQWGTPEDLEEYEAWSQLIHSDFNIPKAVTNITEIRESFVTIPYESDSSEFKKSYNYWKSYFQNL